MQDPNLLITTILLLVTGSTSIGEHDVDLIKGSMDLALKSIKEADSAGIDVTGLVKNFNEALDLVRQAESSDFRTCSGNDCVSRANEIFISIVHDSSLVERHDSNSDRILSLALSTPVGAFTASVLGLYTYNAWKSYHVKKFLSLEIREKED